MAKKLKIKRGDQTPHTKEDVDGFIGGYVALREKMKADKKSQDGMKERIVEHLKTDGSRDANGNLYVITDDGGTKASLVKSTSARTSPDMVRNAITDKDLLKRIIVKVEVVDEDALHLAHSLGQITDDELNACLEVRTSDRIDIREVTTDHGDED